MNHAVTRRLRSKSINGVVALVLGTAGAQAVGFFSLPLLSRLYDPSSFGAFLYITSLVLIISAVASLKLEWAILLPEDLSSARALVRLSLYVALAISMLTLALVALMHQLISQAAHMELYPWLLFLPPLVLVTSWFAILSQAALRERAYSSVAARTVTQGIATAVGQLGMATLTRSPGGLLAGQLLGRTFGIVALSRGVRRLLARPAHGQFKRVLRRYWRMPLVFAPSAMLNNIGTQMPLIIVTGWFGIDAGGLFGAAQRLVLIPASLVGTAVGQVFAAELTARIRVGTTANRRLYLHASKNLSLLAVVLFVVLLTTSKVLTPFILGQNWEDAGSFAQALSISVAIGFVASPMSFVFVAYQKTKLSIIVDASRIACVGGAALLADIQSWDAVQTVWAMSIGQFLNYLVTWIVGLGIVSKVPDGHLATPASNAAKGG